MSDSSSLSIQDIENRLPHRFPFLMIDRVLSFQPGPDPAQFKGRKVIVRKNVTANEPYFPGHFPGNPVMPGVLQIEAMAQAGAVACVPEHNDQVDVLIAKVNDGRFRKPVTPGDTLEIHAEILAEKRGILVVDCKALCEGEVVSEVRVTAKVVARKKDSSS